MNIFIGIISLLVVGSLSASASTSPAQYVVTSDTSIEPSNYNVDDLSFTADASGLKSMRFTLPADLVGPQSQALVLNFSTDTSDDGIWNASNDLLDATCMDDPHLALPTQCIFSFSEKYIKVLRGNESAIHQYLNETYGSNATVLAQKIQAADDYKADPEGVLNFNMNQ